MAKNKRKIKKNKRFLNRLITYFLPTQFMSVKGWLWFVFSRIGLAITSFFLIFTLIFSVVPVPFSAYMVQKKVEHLIQWDDYEINYKWVSLDRISWQMQIAVIASEDQKFDSHFGIDFNAIEMAIKRNSKYPKKKQIGASTISQQTVKNLYLWHGASWVRKGFEVPLTFLVESVWDKRRILEVYLNIAEFGDGIFGVEAAAKHYFKKSASQLTMQEAALLAASLPNPLIYKVKNPTSTMRKRQQWIMRQAQNLGGRGYLENL
ncbi:monofunctional biosynthetic peptidoglycan transglycosylase [Pasteurellaceae bacterium 15-036681]|nr:monofunctional biosynthetic peptidoglycan transglycosylase [Pasteurellaceae bacterium 15-036681]